MPDRFRDAVARLDGDAGLLREMAEMTSPDFPALLNDSAIAVEGGNCEDAVRTLHKLKGMLSTFESDGVVLDIQDMISAARNQNEKLLKQHFERCRPQIEELVGVISDFSRDG